MKLNVMKTVAAVAAGACVVAMFSGCVAIDGAEYRPDAFDVSQINTKEKAKTVQIMSVTPTKIKVTNEQRKKQAQTIGGLLGGIIGVATGASYNTSNAIAGGVGGTVIGAASGSLVSDTALVDGVMLSFKEDGEKDASITAQVGELCQYKAHDYTLAVSMKDGSTRLQPNAVCPVASATTK